MLKQALAKAHIRFGLSNLPTLMPLFVPGRRSKAEASYQRVISGGLWVWKAENSVRVTATMGAERTLCKLFTKCKPLAFQGIERKLQSFPDRKKKIF